MNKYIIVSNKVPVFLFIGEIVLLPILCYLLFSIIGIAGVIFLLVLWLIGILGVVAHFIGRNTRFELSDTGITLFSKGRLSNFGWSDITRLGFQASVAKRMGVYEIIPYLALELTDSSREKLNLIESSKEYGFIQKKDDFDKYLSKEKLDLYLSMKMADEDDVKIIDFLTSKSRFEKSIPPLVKTIEQAEYENVVKRFFVEQNLGK